MTTNSNKRQNIWMPLLFSAVLVGGMFIGFKLNETLSNKRSINNVIDRNDRIEEIIDLISSRYVETISEDTLYQDAVEGVLQHLDPHTFYLNAKDALSANESIEGNFKGIGVEFYVANDTVVIISVSAGSPSEKAGIKVGDRLLKIDEQIVSGAGMNEADVKNTMLNVNKSIIELSVLKADKDIVAFQIAKGNVPLKSIDVSCMLSGKIGYIRLNRFSATSYEEFKLALATLRQQGMESLIFDLRQNPGGLLDEGIKILDEFIAGKQLLVYTSGKAKEQTDYYAAIEGDFEKGKLVILIDEASASASEIVAGGVQDLDRGIIVGRTSFGKGLVQEQFELSDGAALRLTVAKYYTPSGRGIQKSYDKGRMAYNGRNNEEAILLSDYSKEAKIQQTEVFKSLHLNRIVHAEGGGVHPDISVAMPSYLLSPDLWTLLELIDAYSYSYFANHIDEYTKFGSLQQYNQFFFVSKEQLNEYKNNLPPKYIQSINVVWSNPKMVEYLKLRIKANYARFLFRSTGYYTIMLGADEEVKMATQIINSNRYKELLPS